MGYGSPLTGYRLRVMGYGLQVTGFGLQLVGHGLGLTRYWLQVMGFILATKVFVVKSFLSYYGLWVRSYRYTGCRSWIMSNRLWVMGRRLKVMGCIL